MLFGALLKYIIRLTTTGANHHMLLLEPALGGGGGGGGKGTEFLYAIISDRREMCVGGHL